MFAITSTSFAPGQAIPATFAMGAPEESGGNRNPQLAWHDVPPGTRSFVLLCVDPDAPTDPSLAGKQAPIAIEHPRGDFVHWVMADIPAQVREITEGSCSDGVTARGKSEPKGPKGARQGRNSYSEWFEGDAEMGGWYLGYDGPYPPGNDLRVHRYFFRLFALDVETLDLPAAFTAAHVQRAMHAHVLGEALVYGTYSLNPDVRG